MKTVNIKTKLDNLEKVAKEVMKQKDLNPKEVEQVYLDYLYVGYRDMVLAIKSASKDDIIDMYTELTSSRFNDYMEIENDAREVLKDCFDREERSELNLLISNLFCYNNLIRRLRIRIFEAL